MKQLIKIITLALFVFVSTQVGFSQRSKKKGKDSCPAHTEDLQKQLPQYEMPNFDSDTLSMLSQSGIVLKDDAHKVDSVEQVLENYYENKKQIRGWRIQVWTGQKESGMKLISAQYKDSFEELNLFVHEEWDNTFFRVKIGDFTDRLEAYKALMKIKEQFSNALLVPDEVDLNKI